MARDLGLDEVVDHFTLVGDEVDQLRNKAGGTRLGFALTPCQVGPPRTSPEARSPRPSLNPVVPTTACTPCKAYQRSPSMAWPAAVNTSTTCKAQQRSPSMASPAAANTSTMCVAIAA